MIRKRAYQRFLLTGLLWLPLCELRAVTINAASASDVAITAAIALANTGDTVLVPAGTVTWLGTVFIPDSKNITLRGAGIGQTVVSSGDLTQMLVKGSSRSRVTGFTFSKTGGVSTTLVIARGRGFRIDNCRFESPSYQIGVHALSAATGGLTPKGVIDHCQFQNCRVLINGIFDNNLAASGSIYAAPLGLGTDEFVFIEDNTFLFTVFGNCVDSRYSSRYIFRHNDVQDTYVEAHSMSTGGRGSRAWEIYENTIRLVDRAITFPMFLRGGTGVCYNNTITGGFTGQIFLDNRRTNPNDAVANDPSNGAFGGNPMDGNEALPDGSGQHNGSPGVATLTDSNKTWTTNSFKVIDTSVSPNEDRGFFLYNLTDGSKGEITSNTGTTVTATLTGGTRNNWNAGDSYKITDGYAARDQIGRSTDAWRWTTANPYPPQAFDPAYFWGNTKNGATAGVGVSQYCTRHIQQGRDYMVNSGPKPGYTPYTYPHPLVSGQSPPPDAPTGLRIAPP